MDDLIQKKYFEDPCELSMDPFCYQIPHFIKPDEIQNGDEKFLNGVESAADSMSQKGQQILAQVETENFWHDLGHAFTSAAKWTEGAVKTVGNVIASATVALGTKKFWDGVGNTVATAAEDGLEDVLTMGSETPI